MSTLWEVSWRAPSRLVKYYYISPKRDDPSSGHFSSIPYLNTSNLEVFEHLQVGGVHTSNLDVRASHKEGGLQAAHSSARLNRIVVNLYSDVYCTKTFL